MAASKINIATDPLFQQMYGNNILTQIEERNKAQKAASAKGSVTATKAPEAAATDTSWDLYTATPSLASYGSGGSSYDYNAGDVTDRERTAAANLGTIANYNAQSTKDQLGRQLANYDTADAQNRSLADVQRNQNSRKAASERFAANKKLQTATHGVLGAAGNALNGSSLFELLNMLNTRTDLDNNEIWNALTQNWNAVENANQESLNQNNLSRNDAAINAEFALRGIESDMAAQLNNINPNLFTTPGEGDANQGSSGVYDANKRAALQAQLAGYIMPDNAATTAREKQPANTMTGDSYYDRLLNQYNARRK